MGSEELRKRFLEFFKERGERGHAVVPSSSLVPDDPSVLLTTAGMQQFKPYYTGQADPFVSPHPTLGGKPLGSKNAASIQKSFRTSDIDEVGDERHLTFFEMMGNFSFGGYFKEEAIRYAKEFLDSTNIKIDYVTVFNGDESVPQDDDSVRIWKTFGFSKEQGNLRFEGRADNFWGPTGNEGPCGPTTEIYAAGVEIWNIVFNEYYQHPDKTLEKLKTPGVDTGMGLERLAMVSQGKANIFETDLFEPIMSSIIQVLGDKPTEKVRLIADHLRAAVFLIGDGIIPGKDERNYIPRRLIRDAMTAHYLYIGAGLDKNFFWGPVNAVVDAYKEAYPHLLEKHEEIIQIFRKEAEECSKVLELVGDISDLEKIYDSFNPPQRWADIPRENKKLNLSGKILFRIRETRGVSWSMMKMVIEKGGFKLGDNVLSEYNKAYREAQEISRAGQEKKFGGHGLLLDTGELKAANEEELKIVTRLHTATHLLQAGLRKILGGSVHQAGSDITAERLRFDFTFERKLTPEEIQKVGDWVNGVIKKDVPMGYKEMPYGEAIKTGALYFEKEKYPAMVKVYSAADPNTGEVFSKELCGGPHVTHTGEVGHFKILKEESVGAGVRRLRATVE